jgi:hypothetical protein
MDGRKRNMTITLSDDYWDLLERLSETERRGYTDVIRLALDAYTERIGIQPARPLPKVYAPA